MTNTNQTTLILPQTKSYQQWRSGRSVIFVFAMTISFMMGGIMTNMMVLGEPIIGYAIALGTFFATLAIYVYDEKALGLRASKTETASDEFTVPAEANDQNRSGGNNRKVA